MKIFFFSLLSFFMLSFFSLEAQNTTGKEFYLTFGSNWGHTTPSELSLYIRIVNGNNHTKGTIYFTNLGTSEPFTILAHQVFTYNLKEKEK